jgi:hypothetical protein
MILSLDEYSWIIQLIIQCPPMPELRSQALQLLSLCDPSEKGAAVIALREQYLQGTVTINAEGLFT